MRSFATALFRAVAAVIGAVADRLTPWAPSGDLAAQRAWLLRPGAEPLMRPALSRREPRRRHRHGGYGNAGAGLVPH
ncbi:hypothetical protein JIG36_47100 [Actinoplanes sp. LDG1-06]|uniref:Uncharacterized protein n=1 Tax=Paractinoplanes ovalisporus TaxID=2810368 RepID=A0ABS2ATE6_9ACTN|nr:hypothetical protein [Actinoplanes ovalisporus]MBM2623094.1 hypothetical protein [Actinoplanes ovalisporus]